MTQESRSYVRLFRDRFPLERARRFAKSLFHSCPVSHVRARARPSPDPILPGIRRIAHLWLRASTHRNGLYLRARANRRRRPRRGAEIEVRLARDRARHRAPGRGFPRPRRGPRDARRGRHARIFPEGCRHRRRSHRDQLACDPGARRRFGRARPQRARRTREEVRGARAGVRRRGRDHQPGRHRLDPHIHRYVPERATAGERDRNRTRRCSRSETLRGCRFAGNGQPFRDARDPNARREKHARDDGTRRKRGD